MSADSKTGAVHLWARERLNGPASVVTRPKGVVHHGPLEAALEEYQAWLLETRARLRFTPEAVAASELMDTGNYGRHPNASP